MGALRSSRSLLVLLPLLAARAVAQDDYVPTAALHEAGLAKFWQLRLPLEPGQKVAELFRVDDHLYVTTDDGYAYAVHANTGAIRWLRRITTGGYRIFRPAHTAKRVIFVTPPAVRQFGRYFGEPLSEMSLNFPAASAPYCDGLHYFLGGLNERLYAFYPTWIHGPVWKTVGNGPVSSRPVSVNGVLYFAGDRGTIAACRAENKIFIWQRSVDGAVTADLVVDANGVYVASRDQSLYLLESSSGGLRWRARLNSPLYEPPVATPEVAYQYCIADGLVAVNVAGPNEQRVRWKVPSAHHVLAIGTPLLYSLTNDGRILAIREDSGAVEHEIPAPGLTLAVPNAAEPVLIVGSVDGRLFAARPKSAPPLTAADVRHAVMLERVAASGTTPETGAAASAASADILAGLRLGVPIGGKSRVSREFGSANSGSTPPSATPSGGAPPPAEPPASQPAESEPAAEVEP